jgi:hypothetical protein
MVGAPFWALLAQKVDEVRIGLPDEYAEAVVRGAATSAETVGAPVRRTLWFRCAAHGLVNSSPSIFELASEIVLRLLAIPNGDEESQIRALLERARGK